MTKDSSLKSLRSVEITANSHASKPRGGKENKSTDNIDLSDKLISMHLKA